MSPGRILLIAGSCSLLLAASCAHHTGHEQGATSQRFTVSFPSVKLEHGEHVQSVTLHIYGGRITAINRLLDSWDVSLLRESAGFLNLRIGSRHFDSGLADVRQLNEFLTVQATGQTPLIIKAIVSTESSAPTGRNDRTIKLSHAELILKPITGRANARHITK
jgi:hypothetical protein